MNDATANPVIVGLLFILRCLVPLVILFGISYLLRRLGLVNVESAEPAEEDLELLDEGDNSAPANHKES